jgi:hypothetical protein
MLSFWHDEKFWENITKFITVLVALLTVMASLVGVLFGSGIFNKWFDDTFYPKYTPLTAKVPLEPDNNYYYCVKWQANQPYHIDVSSISTPVRMLIVNESNYKKENNNEHFEPFYASNGIFSSSIVYTPKNTGVYYVLIDNFKDWLPAKYYNQSTVFNISIEAYKSCSDE